MIAASSSKKDHDNGTEDDSVNAEAENTSHVVSGTAGLSKGNMLSGTTVVSPPATGPGDDAVSPCEPTSDVGDTQNGRPSSTSPPPRQWQSPGSSQTNPPERLLVVANRLPMTIVPPHEGNTGYTFAVSNGGLVSGLRGIRGINFIWIGWPGTQIPLEDRAYVTQECQKCGCHPVFLDRATIDLFYNGFCNNVLWPLIHYIPPPMEVGCNDTHADQWDAYCRANVSFVEAILEIYDDNDLVWVHDYHLMLVPKLLRSRKPDARIGWFLHTPFPSQEMFRMLPYRTELLTGLLSANLAGFHVYDYLRHFLSSCVQLLGLESTAQGVDGTPVGGVFVNCGAIPIGIETQQFNKKLRDVGVVEAIRRLKAQFGRRKVILGVDRLDYMKGLPHKLNAFDRFLELYPSWSERCVLVQLAVPSRTLVPEYQRLKSTVHELVGMINGRRGNLTHVPVHYLDQSLSFDELVALYRVADVALITSLRDGMNLVAYEFIACQAGKYGVLILSEFAGAAQSLGAGSIRVNPWNLDETAEAIHRALSMSRAERRSRHDYAMNHVRIHTSQKWAEIFIESLRDASERSAQVRASVPPPLEWPGFLEKFIMAKRRLIIMDLLDALTPARGNRGIPMKRFKRLIHLPHDVLEALSTLSQQPSTVVIVTTPHPSATLERIFANTRVCLAAEKGCVYRNRQGEWVRFVEERMATGSGSGAAFPGLPGGSSNPAATESHRGSLGSSGVPGSTPALPLSGGGGGGSGAASGASSGIAVTATSLLRGKSEIGTPLAGPRQPSSESSPVIGRAGQGPPVVTVSNDWSTGVEKVFEFFQRRTPGSYTERTTGTLTWYWDDTLPDFGKQQSRDLLVHLWAGPLANASSADVEVVVGSRFIEVRSPQCSRIKLMQRILEHEFGHPDPLSALDFVACIGNFPRRDEDVHSLFQQTSVSVPRENSNWSEFSTVSLLASVPNSCDKIDEAGAHDVTIHLNTDTQDHVESTTGTLESSAETQQEMVGSRRASTQLDGGGGSPPASDCDLLGPVYVSISVGAGLVSRARYCLFSAHHVQALVRDLAHYVEIPVETALDDIRKLRPPGFQPEGIEPSWKQGDLFGQYKGDTSRGEVEEGTYSFVRDDTLQSFRSTRKARRYDVLGLGEEEVIVPPPRRVVCRQSDSKSGVSRGEMKNHGDYALPSDTSWLPRRKMRYFEDDSSTSHQFASMSQPPWHAYGHVGEWSSIDALEGIAIPTSAFSQRHTARVYPPRRDELSQGLFPELTPEYPRSTGTPPEGPPLGSSDAWMAAVTSASKQQAANTLPSFQGPRRPVEQKSPALSPPQQHYMLRIPGPRRSVAQRAVRVVTDNGTKQLPMHQRTEAAPHVRLGVSSGTGQASGDTQEGGSRCGDDRVLFPTRVRRPVTTKVRQQKVRSKAAEDVGRPEIFSFAGSVAGEFPLVPPQSSQPPVEAVHFYRPNYASSDWRFTRPPSQNSYWGHGDTFRTGTFTASPFVSQCDLPPGRRRFDPYFESEHSVLPGPQGVNRPKSSRRLHAKTGNALVPRPTSQDVPSSQPLPQEPHAHPVYQQPFENAIEPLRATPTAAPGPSSPRPMIWEENRIGSAPVVATVEQLATESSTSQNPPEEQQQQQQREIDSHYPMFDTTGLHSVLSSSYPDSTLPANSSFVDRAYTTTEPLDTYVPSSMGLTDSAHPLQHSQLYSDLTARVQPEHSPQSVVERHSSAGYRRPITTPNDLVSQGLRAQHHQTPASTLNDGMKHVYSAMEVRRHSSWTDQPTAGAETSSTLLPSPSDRRESQQSSSHVPAALSGNSLLPSEELHTAAASLETPWCSSLRPGVPVTPWQNPHQHSQRQPPPPQSAADVEWPVGMEGYESASAAQKSHTFGLP